MKKLVDIKIEEVSAVDKGANGRKFLIIKRAKPDEFTKKTLDEIIESQEARDKFWKVVHAFYESIDSIIYDSDLSENEKADQVRTSADQFGKKLNELAPSLAKRLDVDALVSEAEVKIKKGGKNMDWEDVLKGIEDDKVKDAVVEKVSELEKSIKDLQSKGGTEDIDKSLLPEDVRKRYEALEKRVKIAENFAKKERDERMKAEFAKRAELYKSVGATDKIAGILRKVSESDTDLCSDLEEILKSANERIEKSSLFESAGDKGGDDNSVMAKIEKKARELIVKNADFTYEQAVTKILELEPDLYDSYMEEN